MRALLLLVGASACVPLPWAPCTQDASCHRAFGLGTVCGDAGLCVERATPDRCEALEPPGWLDTSPSPADVFVIGGLSSTVLDIGVDRAYTLAVRHLNDSGGLDGRSFAYARCDYRADPSFDGSTPSEAAIDTARWMVDALGATVFVGPASSGLTADVWSAFEGDVVVISPSATSVALETLDGADPTDEAPGTLWRTATPDAAQGAAIAFDLRAQGAVGVAAVVQAGAYGDGLFERFEASFVGEGRQVARFSFSDPSGLVDATSAAGELSSEGYPWVLFIASGLADAIAFLNATSVSSAYDDRGLYLTDGAADTTLLTGASSASARFEQVRGTRPGRPGGPVFDAFRVAYASAHGGEDPAGFAWAAHAYDATWLAAYGLAWSHLQEGAVTADGIGRGLRRVSDGVPVALRPSGWPVGVAAFTEGEGVDLEGASGPLDYDPLTEETSGPVDIWVIDTEAQSIAVVGTCDPDGDCTYR